MRRRIPSRIAVASLAVISSIVLTFGGFWGVSLIFPYTGYAILLPPVLLFATIVGSTVSCKCLGNRSRKYSIIRVTIGAGLGLVFSYFVLLGIAWLSEELDWEGLLMEGELLGVLLIGIPLFCFFTGAYLGTRCKQN